MIYFEKKLLKFLIGQNRQYCIQTQIIGVIKNTFYQNINNVSNRKSQRQIYHSNNFLNDIFPFERKKRYS